MSKPALLLLLLCSLVGCKEKEAADAKKSPSVEPAPPAAAPKPVTRKTTPSECGLYRVDVKLPPRFHCKVDADCEWTGQRPGNCNPPLCSGHYGAGNRAWVKAVKALHERVCRAENYKSCVRVKCVHNKPERAVCEKSSCTIRFAKRGG